MKGYAMVFLMGGLSSAMFIDKSVNDNVARIGKTCLGVFTVLFVIAEAMLLLG